MFSGENELNSLNEIAEKLPHAIYFDKEEKLGVRIRGRSKRTICSTRLGVVELEVERGTNAGGKGVVPDEVGGFVPKGRQFSFDTVWDVTRMRYIENMQRLEIQNKLPFDISTGSISNLYNDGLAYIRACHEAATDDLKNYYRKDNVPFIIQVDGTNEGAGDCLFQVRESRSGNLLHSSKMTTENSTDIMTILRIVEQRYGKPDGVISDMSINILSAVKNLWDSSVPTFICQFHFLRDIGKDLLTDLHNALRTSMTKTSITKKLNRLRKCFVKQLKENDESYYQEGINLIDWISDYKNDLNGLGFPFDLPWKSYYDRCLKMDKHLRDLKSRSGKKTPKVNKMIKRIRRQVNHILKDSGVKGCLTRLKREQELLNEIRSILHQKEISSQAPLSHSVKAKESSSTDEKSLNENIEVMINKLRTLEELEGQSSKLKKKKTRYQKAAEQLEKYQHQLVDYITIGGQIHLLPRTNNLCETSFRDLKRNFRRTTGKKNLSYVLNGTAAEVLYLQNLKDAEYCRIVFKGRDIHEVFAEMLPERVKEIRAEMKSNTTKHKDLSLIRKKDFLVQNQKNIQGIAS